MLEVLVVVLLGVGLGVAIAWLALSGVLALAFSRAKSYVKRVAERRRAAHAVHVNRRQHAERRAG